MSGYGFGKRLGAPQTDAPADQEHLDLSGITRVPLTIDPAREAAALERGTALGFVDRGDGGAGDAGAPIVRRRRQVAPQSSVYIKGPKDTLDWFIEYTNQRAHRSYWQTLEDFRAMVERSEDAGTGGDATIR